LCQSQFGLRVTNPRSFLTALSPIPLSYLLVFVECRCVMWEVCYALHLFLRPTLPTGQVRPDSDCPFTRHSRLAETPSLDPRLQQRQEGGFEGQILVAQSSHLSGR
jgi:hypothetical protein